MKKRSVFLILSVIFTLFIFARSLKSADESTQESFFIVRWVEGIIRGIAFSVPANLNELVTVFVRKVAHVVEYAVQSSLLSGFFSAFPQKIKGNISWILFLGLLTACTDEAIQLTSQGRAGLISDIFIDFGGTVLGICLCIIACFINIKIKKA